ncbi:DUF4167 domain-containing protein [Paracoccus cavernae]|uniref:DUF4167 domain-containing protein n=1 Tax=Paracoccus cavernae TaxID=1571207 RepID=UPI0035F2E6A9
MRSSKSRSRNKSNRQRTLGNVVNRVFDSSGPEGKVRGTPQQIIEKYLALARDAQLSNDRVAEQSFLQHAEHYTRLLGEAQREQAERQQHFSSQRDEEGGRDDGHERNGNGNGNGNGGNNRDAHGSAAQPDEGHSGSERPQRDFQREDGNRQREHGNRSNGNRDNRRERRVEGDAAELVSVPEANLDRQPLSIEPTAQPAAQPVQEAQVRQEQARPVETAEQPGLPLAIASSDDEGANPVETPEAQKAAAGEERPAPRRRAPRTTPATPRASAPRSRKKAEGASEAPAEPVGESKAE